MRETVTIPSVEYHPKEEKDLVTRTKIVLARSLGRELDSSDPVAMANAPMINDGEPIAAVAGIRLFDAAQETSVYVDMVGCGIGDCVHCYVPYVALNADLLTQRFQNKINASGQLPAKLKHALDRTDDGKIIPIIDAGTAFQCAYELAQKKYDETGIMPDLALGSGEPLANRAFVLEFAKLSKAHNMRVWIDTAGVPGIDKDYFKPFVEAGLQDTLDLQFSPKGTTPEEYEKFTQGVEGKNWIWPFEGLKAALESGIPANMKGVMVQHFATTHQLKEKENPVTRLVAELRKIHELLPMLLSGLNTTTGRIGDPKRQIIQLTRQGYTRDVGYGRRNEVVDAMQQETGKYGTPMIFPRQRADFDPKKWAIIKEVVVAKIVSDVMQVPPKRIVSVDELAEITQTLKARGIEIPTTQTTMGLR